MLLAPSSRRAGFTGRAIEAGRGDASHRFRDGAARDLRGAGERSVLPWCSARRGVRAAEAIFAVVGAQLSSARPRASSATSAALTTRRRRRGSATSDAGCCAYRLTAARGTLAVQIDPVGAGRSSRRGALSYVLNRLSRSVSPAGARCCTTASSKIRVFAECGCSARPRPCSRVLAELLCQKRRSAPLGPKLRRARPSLASAVSGGRGNARASASVAALKRPRRRGRG